MMLVFGVAMVFFSGVHAKAIRGKEPEVQHPPCYFNALCECSKAFPDLGKVVCKNVPMYRIPIRINASKVYMLHMENNGLRNLQGYFFRNTGLYSIEISRNVLTEVPVDAFAGLERSLWELNLRGNRLREVPSRAIRYLHKLKLLDLSDNEIAFVSSEDWKGLEDSLETLSLRENGLIALQPSAFEALNSLQVLDLTGNALFDIDSTVFKDGPLHLSRLILADNMLSELPFHQLTPLRFLRHLDLSFNRISGIQDYLTKQDVSKGGTLHLDTLRLDYNQIEFLPTASFSNFATLNRTYLNGNPISRIQEDAFRDSNIRELHLRDCSVSEILPEMLDGLQKSLRVLDLSGNNLTKMPGEIFREFDLLHGLSLEENPLEIMEEPLLDVLQDSIRELDLRGDEHQPANLRNLGKLRNIRSLSLSRTKESDLSPEDFNGFSIDFEELRISGGNIKTLKNHAFRNVRRLKRLDLSGNAISLIESKAFSEVGHFLQNLCLANGLSPKITKLSSEAMSHLTALEHFDISNNDLKFLEESTFHSMKQLKILKIQDNRIEDILKGTFQGDAHSELKVVDLSFNRLSQIPSHAFSDLESLEVLHLGDNRIEKLERKAFVNLDRLKYLNLRGNRIEQVSQEAFENLPELEELDLAYNKLTDFSFTWLDQVGVLSSLALNASHNAINRLNESLNESEGIHETMHVNVKVMDFSYNNISYIGRSYFKQIELSITHLFMSHNLLSNITDEVFSNMMHLQWLDLSHNSIRELEFDTFKGAPGLQILNLSWNKITDVPREIFTESVNLRVVDMSNNYLKSLPDMMFEFGSIERVDLSGNQFIRVPAGSFKEKAAASILELDLSKNLIMSLHSTDDFDRFRSLHWVDLSSNPLIRIENGAFSDIGHLHCLDLSHNTDIVLDEKGGTFSGLDDTLEDLYLRNLSLIEIPELHLPNLKNLDLSNNEITSVPTELSQNLPSLRRLELSGNQLTTLPLAVNSLTQLQYLGLSDNEIDRIAFQRGSRLRELDIRNLPITYSEGGVLDHLEYLETVKLSLPKEFSGFNLPALLQENQAVKHVYIESLREGPPFGAEMKGEFPVKLRMVTLTGKGFRFLTKDLLEGITSPRLNLIVFNTSIEEIPETIFENAKYVRNVTIDVRSNNLRALGNPNSGKQPNKPGKSFLLGLKMADNEWNCDCELGWIEGWDRVRRQYICEEIWLDCHATDDDLRLAVCENEKPKSVLEMLKTDLECGWDSSPGMDSSPAAVAVLFIITLWMGTPSF